MLGTDLTKYTVFHKIKTMLKWFRRTPYNPTVFGKILRGEIPKDFIYQDSQCVAFESHDKMAEVHVLVIPREHIVSLHHVDSSHTALLGHMLVVAADIARKDERLQEGAFRISINNGREAGQTVEHLHVHILGGEPLGRSCQTPKTVAMDARDKEKLAKEGHTVGDRA